MNMFMRQVVTISQNGTELRSKIRNSYINHGTCMEGGAVTASTWYIVAGFCGEAYGDVKINKLVVFRVSAI